MSTTLAAPPSPAGRLVVSDRIDRRLDTGELTKAQVDEYRRFLDVAERELMQHRIVRDNRYSRWFQQGLATDEELRFFVQQFSVFSNQFLVAALLRVINAANLEQQHASKQILLNELGVIYRKVDAATGSGGSVSDDEKDREGDPDLVSTEGTVDGGIFRFRAAHFEWLLKIGEQLKLGFNDLGKRRHGRPKTLFFCDELQRTYGSEDGQFAEGASFAVENWAAAGFWQELEDGLMQIKTARIPKLPLAFFTWHNRVEGQHAGHTLEELEETYFSEGFEREKFLEGGRQILDGVAAFWDGLEEDRLGGYTKIQGRD
jgi:hypothetical protein